MQRIGEDSLGQVWNVPSWMTPILMSWGAGNDSARALEEELVRRGFRAVAVCVDPRQLDGSFAGRWLDAAFFADLPTGVDPCGENGEFHTFVVDGPGFRNAVNVERGPVVLRDGFVFADLLERSAGAAA